MNVLLIEADVSRHPWVAKALAGISGDLCLTVSENLDGAHEELKRQDFRVVIVNEGLDCDLRSALIFLRGLLPHSALLCGMQISAFGFAPTREFLSCGADRVFDLRLSVLQLSLTLRPFLEAPALSPKSSIYA